MDLGSATNPHPSTEYKRLATQLALCMRNRPISRSVIPSSPIPRGVERGKALGHDITQPIDYFVATAVDRRFPVDV